MKLCLQRRQMKFPMIGSPSNALCCAGLAALLLSGWSILQTSCCVMLLWLMVLVGFCATDTTCSMWLSVRLASVSFIYLYLGYLCVFSVIVILVLPDCWAFISFTCGPSFDSIGCGCQFIQVVMLCITIATHPEDVDHE